MVAVGAGVAPSWGGHQPLHHPHILGDLHGAQWGAGSCTRHLYSLPHLQLGLPDGQLLRNYDQIVHIRTVLPSDDASLQQQEIHIASLYWAGIGTSIWDGDASPACEHSNPIIPEHRLQGAFADSNHGPTDSSARELTSNTYSTFKLSKIFLSIFSNMQLLNQGLRHGLHCGFVGVTYFRSGLGAGLAGLIIGLGGGLLGLARCRKGENKWNRSELCVGLLALLCSLSVRAIWASSIIMNTKNSSWAFI